jgi:thiosulfate/3-mercaptopyruvate sulfurtransferase
MKKNLAIALSALLLSSGSGALAAQPKMNMVVDAQWLASHLADPDLVVLHVGPKDDYAQAHIPGARLVALKDIALDGDGLTLQVPPAPDLRQRLGALGIQDSSRVVVYFAKQWISPATRVVFTLHAAGLGEHVALLDGGIDEWRRQQKATTAQVPAAIKLGGPEVRMQPLVVDADFVSSRARSPGYALVDARAPVYYDGVEPSGAMGKRRKGHIPGAVNIPFTQIAGLDNKLKTPAQLEALFRDSGIKAGTRLIVYCHIGQQATAILFAARSLGIDAVLYDGSFEDWTLNNGPVEAAAGR